ncbi:MAG: hypothetical protein ABJN26_16630 [Stappiaceae bacterium]
MSEKNSNMLNLNIDHLLDDDPVKAANDDNLAEEIEYWSVGVEAALEDLSKKMRQGVDDATRPAEKFDERVRDIDAQNALDEAINSFPDLVVKIDPTK